MTVRAAREGFREYDMRWRYPEDASLEGLRAAGLAIGAWLGERGAPRRIVIGHDYRSYSAEVRDAVAEGLASAGLQVIDIGLALSPTVYFAQFELGGLPGAAVTASHNPNGWTGIKVSACPPLTAGPEDIARIRALVLEEPPSPRPGGKVERHEGMAERYLEDLAAGGPVDSPLRVLCATGNGTAGKFAPRMIEALGCEAVHRHTELDHSFPHYNPNPESETMLADMAEAVVESNADLACGFDGDGDRLGVVDGSGQPIYADRLGLLIARQLATANPGAMFLADVKSTGLFAVDPVLRRHGCTVRYVPTGHTYMKRELHESGALAAFERSGHFLFAPPLGRGYDDGLNSAAVLLRLLAESGRSLQEMAAELPPSWTSPSLQPPCADSDKYGVVAEITETILAMKAEGKPLAGMAIADVLTINGVRATMEGGAWLLVRASSNTPNLVVIAESVADESETRRLLLAARELLSIYPQVDASVIGD